jgi:hypothetical protein
MKNIESYFKYVEKKIGGKLVSGFQLQKPDKWKGVIFSFGDSEVIENLDKEEYKGYQLTTKKVSTPVTILYIPKNVSEVELEGAHFNSLLNDILICVLKQLN